MCIGQGLSVHLLGLTQLKYCFLGPGMSGHCCPTLCSDKPEAQVPTLCSSQHVAQDEQWLDKLWGCSMVIPVCAQDVGRQELKEGPSTRPFLLSIFLFS